MAKDPGQANKAKRSPLDVKPRQRLNYVNIRIGELNQELERLKAERITLRTQVAAERDKKPKA